MVVFAHWLDVSPTMIAKLRTPLFLQWCPNHLSVWMAQCHQPTIICMLFCTDTVLECCVSTDGQTLDPIVFMTVIQRSDVATKTNTL
uniref:Uncharacterized protein n=1 Tax=Anguilla anguilla TaxID=7936 RepID=A0A0E9XFS0_ANGAN